MASYFQPSGGGESPPTPRYDDNCDLKMYVCDRKAVAVAVSRRIPPLHIRYRYTTNFSVLLSLLGL